MDTTDYENKVNIMLQDDKTYEELPADPTPKYKCNLISILLNLRKENKLTEAEYRHFYPTSETTPRLYCIPKIHKKDNPLRHIVDYTHDRLGTSYPEALRIYRPLWLVNLYTIPRTVSTLQTRSRI